MDTGILRLPCLLFVALTVSTGEPLPDEFLKRLTSESFLEREEAQDDLLGWARDKNGSRAKSLMGLLAEDDPEVRKRSLEVLRRLSDEDYLSDGQGYVGIIMGEEILQAGLEGKPGAGIRISRVMIGSPADSSGLKVGDLILALDGEGWHGKGALDAFMKEIADRRPLVKVALTIRRDAPEPVIINVELGKRPVPDLNLSQEDPQTLDLRAKDEHFKQWLERLENDSE